MQFQTAYELASNPTSPNIQSPVFNTSNNITIPVENGYSALYRQKQSNHHYSIISDNFHPNEERYASTSNCVIHHNNIPKSDEYSYTQVIKTSIPDSNRYNTLQHSLPPTSRENYNKLNHHGPSVDIYNSLEESQEPPYKTLVTEPQHHQIKNPVPFDYHSEERKYHLLSAVTTFKTN